jgi:RNA polymerase sigma-70 factor (ECF subfamily)
VSLLREAMNELPETLRTAVLLRDIKELTYQEIADTLRLPEGTVKSRINRGRAELARQIKRLKSQYEQAAGSRREPDGSGGAGNRSGVSG